MKTDILPVLIVGGGPSGLMMAHELLRFGIPITIIEKDLEKSPYSRAIGVQIRTLEIFSSLGLYEDLAKCAQYVDNIEAFVEERKPIKIALSKTTSFFDKLLVIDQPNTEMVLENAIDKFAHKTVRGIELVALYKNENFVTAKLKDHNGDTKTQQFSYIIGADGTHSVVRKSMVNQFLGTTYDEAFILADVQCVNLPNHHTFNLFFKKKYFLAMIPMYGKDHYRLISVRRKESQKQGPPPTIEEFQNIAKEVVPFPIEITNPNWVSRFFVQCRSASHYQENRLFLVGDAAHIHSPAGGQGMNTGLQDSFNLAWKLAMVIKGIAKPEILLTYHQERKPVGDFLIHNTDRLFKFMVKSSIWARLVRRYLLPRIAKSKKLKSRLTIIGSQTAIRYKTGVICEEKHITLPELKIGIRIPNLRLVSQQNNQLDLHKFITDLFFSCLFFLPKNMSNKDIEEVYNIVHSMNESLKNLKCYLILEREAIKVPKYNELVIFSMESSKKINEPHFVVVRPDQHVFCMGLLRHIDHVEKGLKNFLNTNLNKKGNY